MFLDTSCLSVKGSKEFYLFKKTIKEKQIKLVNWLLKRKKKVQMRIARQEKVWSEKMATWKGKLNAIKKEEEQIDLLQNNGRRNIIKIKI